MDIKIQNKLKQNGIPTNVTQLIDGLRTTFRIKKTPNTILNELTKVTQGNLSIAKFVDNIENLIPELNELQITELGETVRDVISNIDFKIGFNSL